MMVRELANYVPSRMMIARKLLLWLNADANSSSLLLYLFIGLLYGAYSLYCRISGIAQRFS